VIITGPSQAEQSIYSEITRRIQRESRVNKILYLWFYVITVSHPILNEA